MTNPKKDNTKILLLCSGLFLLIIWVILIFGWQIFNHMTIRAISDNSDIGVYFNRGEWLINRTPPISEYPQIPTLFFGINRFASKAIRNVDFLKVYASIFWLEMLVVLFFVIKGLIKILPNDKKHFALLALLPPTLYFTYNRFDILPAYLCLLAYIAATQKKWGLATFILVLGTFTKWYPALLFPGFLWYANSKESKFQWKLVLIFILTSAFILAISVFLGGLRSTIAPYAIHLARNMENVSLPILIYKLIPFTTKAFFSVSNYFLIFFILQVSGAFIVFFIKLKALEDLINYSILTIGLFILFSRIWSPQWFLWLIPFLIIASKNYWDVGLILAYNLITYISFPTMYDMYNGVGIQLIISTSLLYFILLIIIFQSITKLNFNLPSILKYSKVPQKEI